MKYQVLVIGSGPGGYVAAIRASQLNLSVAIVERSELGGICLNWGCIPTKSLLKSGQVFEYAKKSADYGVEIDGDIKPNLPKMVERSRGVAANMSKGVQLAQENKIDVIQGFGKLAGNGKVEVTGEDGTKLLSRLTILFCNWRTFETTSKSSARWYQNYWIPQSFNFRQTTRKHGSCGLGSNW